MNHSDTRIISNMLQLTYQSYSHNWSINYKSSFSKTDPSKQRVSWGVSWKVVCFLNWINLVSGQSLTGGCSSWNILDPDVKNLFCSRSLGGDRGSLREGILKYIFSRTYDWRSLAWRLCICGICGVKKATMVELATIEIKTFVVFDKGLGFDRHLSKDYGLLVRFSSTVSGLSPIFSWSNRQLNHSRENGSAGETTNLCFSVLLRERNER